MLRVIVMEVELEFGIRNLWDGIENWKYVETNFSSISLGWCSAYLAFASFMSLVEELQQQREKQIVALVY